MAARQLQHTAGTPTSGVADTACSPNSSAGYTPAAAGPWPATNDRSPTAGRGSEGPAFSSVVGAEALAEGVSKQVSFQVLAASREVRRYLLDGYERVEWRCRVLGGYNIDFTAKVMRVKDRSAVSVTGCRVGLVGVDNSRVVSECERHTAFHGYLDLGAEHLGCIGGFPAPCVAGVRRGDESLAVLTLEFDNTFSYFTGKTVELQLEKVAGAAPSVASYNQAIAACKVPGEWDRALRLLDRMRSVNVPPDVGTFNEAIGVCGAGHWEEALALLAGMPSAGLMPNASSYTAAIVACEGSGQAEQALKLMDEMGDAAETEGDEKDLAWLGQMLDEVLLRCPRRAAVLRSHLLAARGSLAELAAADAAVASGGH